MSTTPAINQATLAQLGNWSRTGLSLPEAMSFEEWMAVGDQLRAVEQSVMWWIGDWLRFGERRYGETYAQAVEATGYSTQTLMDARWVADRYDPSLRRENLSFAHHKNAAALPELERAEVLQAAVDNGWSVKALREEVMRRRSSEQTPAFVAPESPFGYALRCMARLVAAVFDLDPQSFIGESKGGPDQVHARQVLIYLLRTEGDFDQSVIADGLGRHHSTVWHAVQGITAMREDPDIDQAFTRLGEMYRYLSEARSRVPDLLEALAP